MRAGFAWLRPELMLIDAQQRRPVRCLMVANDGLVCRASTHTGVGVVVQTRVGVHLSTMYVLRGVFVSVCAGA